MPYSATGFRDWQACLQAGKERLESGPFSRYNVQYLLRTLRDLSKTEPKGKEPPMPHFNIVLHEPEIPSNTGNIGRTCVAAGASLHLIEPLGFRLNEKNIRRAGMDYWEKLDVTRYLDYADFIRQHGDAPIFYASTKAARLYTEVAYPENCFIMFGKESGGIPEDILRRHPDTAVRIPMLEDIRSLNLANSVAIVLYEALRQHDFSHMQKKGMLAGAD